MRYLSSESPCIQVCVIDSTTKICSGCSRTLSEIAEWSSMSELEREQVNIKCEERISLMFD